MAQRAPAAVSQLAVKIDGSNAPEAVMNDLVAAEVNQNLHLPALFTLTLFANNMKWLEEQTLREGKTIELSVGGKKLCQGRISSIEADLPAEQSPTVTVRGYDDSHKLHRNKRTKTYNQVKDSDLASQVASGAGLQADVDATSGVHDYVLQSNESDYDFLRRRAERIGYELFVDAGKVYFKKAGGFKRSQIGLEWGKELRWFRPRLTTTEQVSEVQVRGWDPKQKREIIGRANQPEGSPQIGESRQGPEIAKQVWGDSKLTVVNRPVKTQAEADTIAKARLTETASSFVEAEGGCDGNADILPGAVLDIKGVGSRFSGKYRVSEAQHTYDKNEGYLTNFTVCGQKDNSLLELVRPRPAPPVGAGVVIGEVTNLNDPDDAGRIKVQFKWLADQVESHWMRVASTSAGKDRGIYYLPEVGDEVVIAFEHGDVHSPIVVGSLWNGKDTVPKANSQVVASDGTVSQRIIKSRTGHMIILDDSTGKPGITIIDKTGNNKIIIDSTSNGMKIELQGDLKIETPGNVSLKGMQLKIEGTAGIDIKSSGQVNIKGAIINLN